MGSLGPKSAQCGPAPVYDNKFEAMYDFSFFPNPIFREKITNPFFEEAHIFSLKFMNTQP
jgi:hypothetical protein